jgi:hypothetical protein
MAQTERKRRRKHRGTAAGTVEKPAHGSRRKVQPSGKRDAQMTVAERRHERLAKPPTWSGVLNRSAIAAIIFAVIALVLLKRTVGQAMILAVFALVVYVPASYYTDLLMHRRYIRRHGRR